MPTQPQLYFALSIQLHLTNPTATMQSVALFAPALLQLTVALPANNNDKPQEFDKSAMTWTNATSKHGNPFETGSSNVTRSGTLQGTNRFAVPVAWEVGKYN